MNKRQIVLFSIVSIVVLTTLILQFNKNSSNRKTISTLNSQVDDLEDELKKAKDETAELEEKVSDLEEQLSEVKHFDNDGFIGQGYSSSSSGGVTYTGNAITTKIDGEFNGWDGETIFKMMNGTIWQQSSYNYTYHYAYMPDVIIYKKGGTYYMKVEDVDDEIQVTQIK
jgi:uncharacterized coiled-coil protein SlyX